MSLSVAWRDRPFDGECHRAMVPFRGRPPTIAETLDAVPNLPRSFRDVGEVRLNGEVIPREWWHRVRPRSDRDSSITLHIPIRGGGGGGGGGRTKNPVALAATIGVLLAATVVSAGALGPAGLGLLAAGTFGAGGIGAAVVGAGIGIGGSLLVASLFPPPTTAVSVNQQTAQPVQLGPASIQGNALSPGSAMPRVLGTMRVFPPFLTPQLVELKSGGVEYAETVMGLAGPHNLSAIQVDGIDISEVPEASIEIQTGTNKAVTQGLVTRQGFTIEPNLTLSSHRFNSNSTDLVSLDPSMPVSLDVPQWHKFVTRNGPDEIWIHLNFEAGLGDGTRSLIMPLRFQIRRAGTSTWTNLPELHYMRKPTAATTPFKTEVRLKFQSPPPIQTVAPVYGTNGGTGWIFAFKNVPGQALTPATAGWTADSYFSEGSGNDVLSSARLGSSSNVKNVDITNDNAVIYLDPSIFPPDYYEIQIRRGMLYALGNFNQDTYQFNGGNPGGLNILDFFEYYSQGTGPAGVINQANIVSTCVVERIVSVWNQNPVQSGDFATISLRVYNRSLQNISVLASGYVYDWDGTGWNTLTTTSNPAPHYRDVLAGQLGSVPLPTNIVDDGGLVTWRTACINAGYTVNAVVEGKTSVDVLTMIAACGYARPANSETWGVIRDYDRTTETPVQIFTPRNMRSFNWQKAFPRMPSGFRIKYQNSVLNYVQDDATIFVDPVNQDGNNLESLTYDGLVGIADVNRRAAYDLQTAVSRMTFYNGDVDIESIVCKRGDLVGVQHDTIDTRAGFARVRSVITANGLVTGLILEGTVPIAGHIDVFSSSSLFNETNIFNLGGQTGIAIRLKGGAGVITEAINASTDSEVTSVTFTTPFADLGTSQLDSDCLCTVGLLGSEFRRLIVYGWVPKTDLTASITFVDEAPDLWPPKLGTTSGVIVVSDDDLLRAFTKNPE